MKLRKMLCMGVLASSLAGGLIGVTPGSAFAIISCDDIVTNSEFYQNQASLSYDNWMYWAGQGNQEQADTWHASFNYFDDQFRYYEQMRNERCDF